MEFESQIKKFPDCKSCELVQQEETSLRQDPKMAKKHVILNHCYPKLSRVGLHNVTFIGVVTDEGRLQRLVSLHPNEEVEFSAPMIEIKKLGNCKPLIAQVATNATGKIFKFLHLE